MTATVAALYIDPRGPYPHIAHKDDAGVFRFVDCWDVTRDARLYAGPWPVVAHSPCGAWSQHRARYKGTDADCGPRAVEQVRTFGGVLEHPAGSKLWEECGLPAPSIRGEDWRDLADIDEESFLAVCGDAHGGYAIEVEQVEWGHVARKRTWLYLVGVPREALEAPPFPGREPTHWCSGRRGVSKRGTATVPPGISSAQQRRRTPPLFAEYLVRLARAVRRP